MKLSRNLTLAIHFLLDECLPPIVRDSKWFMWVPYRILFHDKSKVFFTFKEQAPSMSEDEFRQAYEITSSVHIQRDTDLNDSCIERIIDSIAGKQVLDIGCGRGHLSGLLAQRGNQVTGSDIYISPEVRRRYPSVEFKQANIEHLPFEDNSFDTVVCAHTLEHVQNLDAAMAELRRVARSRLLIIVPKQRNYQYTFDLHLRFFAYPHDLLIALGNHGASRYCDVVGGDLFYVEEQSYS